MTIMTARYYNIRIQKENRISLRQLYSRRILSYYEQQQLLQYQIQLDLQQLQYLASGLARYSNTNKLNTCKRTAVDTTHLGSYTQQLLLLQLYQGTVRLQYAYQQVHVYQIQQIQYQLHVDLPYSNTTPLYVKYVFMAITKLYQLVVLSCSCLVCKSTTCSIRIDLVMRHARAKDDQPCQ